MLKSVVCHRANRPMSWRAPLGESTFGRNDRISVSVSLTEALSMVFTTESEQEGERKQHILLGSIDGVKGRALASHRCGPGSPLVVDAQCGLIVSLVCPYLYIARAVRGKTKSAVYMEF